MSSGRTVEPFIHRTLIWTKLHFGLYRRQTRVRKDVGTLKHHYFDLIHMTFRSPRMLKMCIKTLKYRFLDFSKVAFSAGRGKK